MLTFTGMCLQWDSYCLVKNKVSFVRCLVNRALLICSDGKLSDEPEFLKALFVRNGYPVIDFSNVFQENCFADKRLSVRGAGRQTIPEPYIRDRILFGKIRYFY